MPTLLSFKPPTYDIATTYPKVRRTLDAAQREDAQALVAAYQAIDGWAGRYLASTALARDRRHGAFLRQARSENPGSTAIGTMLACWTISEAWRIRTSARARYVSDRQFAAFHDRLGEAESILARVTAAEPGNLAAWTMRVTTARGLELGVAEARRRYDQVARQDPHFLPAQSQLLQQLCPKWGGSFEQAFAFAKERADAAPEGALNPSLVVEAHLEYWLDNGARGAFPGGRDLSYLRRRDVRREVDEASAKLAPPHNAGTDGWITAYNAFAMFYAITWRCRSATVYFKALGNYATTWPWDYLGGRPAFMFSAARFRTMVFG